MEDFVVEQLAGNSGNLIYGPVSAFNGDLPSAPLSIKHCRAYANVRARQRVYERKEQDLQCCYLGHFSWIDGVQWKNAGFHKSD